MRLVEQVDGPLYADELAWLYNEIGLAYYVEGAVLDALSIWEQGYTINRMIDSIEDGGQYLFQSYCNLGAAFLQFGRLATAEEYLKSAQKVNQRFGDEDHAGRILGYLATIKHLRGDLRESDATYSECLKQIRGSGGNLRAESVFMRCWGDVLINLEDFRRSDECIRAARAMSDSARYPDLGAFIRVTQGHWYRAQKQYVEAIREYDAALIDARRMGLRALEADVLSELARVALDLGDGQIARRRALESLRIANQLVLGLRQTHGLIVLGLAATKTGQLRLGIGYLNQAKKLADQQQYFLRGREAERELQRFSELS